jgi:hypothetical protein
VYYRVLAKAALRLRGLARRPGQAARLSTARAQLYSVSRRRLDVLVLLCPGHQRAFLYGISIDAGELMCCMLSMTHM